MSHAYGILVFRCNICGATCTAHMSDLSRESSSCEQCQSTPRFRAVIDALTTEVLGTSQVLADMAPRKNIRGIGLSDWVGYAEHLGRIFDYSNTYYHQAPLLDIMNIDPALEGTLDFLISSEVFEHVPVPVSTAFKNARRLLKPDGVMILTTPYIVAPGHPTIEHFPDLFDYAVEAGDGETVVLVNTTRDGRRQEFRDLVMHGGPGFSLEMRLFTEDGLLHELDEAGFSDVHVYRDQNYDFGVFWPEPWSRVITART